LTFEHNILGFPILAVTVFFPLLVGVGLLFLKDNKTIARVAALGAAVDLVISLIALAAYLNSPEASKAGVEAYGLQETANWMPDLLIRYHMGVDTVSILLIVLTTLLTLISILVSWDPIQKRVKEYYFMMLLLEVGMLGVFASLDFFLFYIFWEVMLVPMALLIGIWGSSNRVYAAVKFFLYTLAGSLLMLVAIIVEYLTNNTLDIVTLQQVGPNNPVGMQNWVFLAFAIAFAIKVPMFPFHTWLPDAHVEAPTAGSIILAGVLLKMGGYGFIRFALPITPAGALNFAQPIIGLSVIAVLYGALVSLVQPDLKKLIAYSSVSHMGFVTLGLFTALLLPESAKAAGTQGIDGAIIVMLSHGLLTGGLFLCVGVIYNRLHSRAIADMGGIAKPMPLFATMFMFMMLGSVGLPGLSGFIGEFLAMQGAFRADWLVGALTAIVVIFAAWYLLWMFQRVVFGKTPPNIARFKDLDWKESSSLVVLSALSLLMVVLPGPVLEMIKPFSLTLLHTTSTAAERMGEAAGLLGTIFK
jgi:NADH-quinone oxidoreductase subunit M